MVVAVTISVHSITGLSYTSVDQILYPHKTSCFVIEEDANLLRNGTRTHLGVDEHLDRALSCIFIVLFLFFSFSVSTMSVAHSIGCPSPSTSAFLHTHPHRDSPLDRSSLSYLDCGGDV